MDQRDVKVWWIGTRILVLVCTCTSEENCDIYARVARTHSSGTSAQRCLRSLPAPRVPVTRRDIAEDGREQGAHTTHTSHLHSSSFCGAGATPRCLEVIGRRLGLVPFE